MRTTPGKASCIPDDNAAWQGSLPLERVSPACQGRTQHAWQVGIENLQLCTCLTQARGSQSVKWPVLMCLETCDMAHVHGLRHLNNAAHSSTADHLFSVHLTDSHSSTQQSAQPPGPCSMSHLHSPDPSSLLCPSGFSVLQPLLPLTVWLTETLPPAATPPPLLPRFQPPARRHIDPG
jgi:hypothetical protein